MTSLPAVSSPTAILSFDFDGTLHDPSDSPPVPLGFFEIIQQLRAEQNIIWGINTGRSMPQVVEGLLESRFPFLPDWVVAREREIYFPNAFGRWLPHLTWNARCEKEVHGLFKHAQKLLLKIRQEIEEHTGAQWMILDGEPAGVISRTEQEMQWIVEHITPLAAAEPHLAWQRNSIYLRFGHRDFQKGSSLSEIAAHYHLSATHCFAMGDSHNDMEMLDPAHAGMAACPANAVAEIQQKITTRSGLITKASYGHGAVEALKHYFLSNRI